MVSKDRGITQILFLIIVLAALLRLWGIGFGLPDLFHADEPTAINLAFAMGKGDLNPHAFWKPSLIYYLLLFEFGLFYLIGFISGRFDTLLDFAALFLNNPTPFYLIARISMGVICGVLTVLFLYLLVSSIYSKKVALLSSLFLAINFLHVRNSHYCWHDIPMVMFLTIGFFYIIRFYHSGKMKDYLICALLSALAVSMKYNALIIIVPILFAHFLRNRQKQLPLKTALIDKRLWSGIGLFILTFFICNPFLFLDLRSFLATLGEQASVVGFMGFGHHLFYSLLGASGVLLFGFSGLGLIFVCLSRRREEMILLSFVFVFYLFLVFFSQPHERYALPQIPLFCMYSAVGMDNLAERFKKKKTLILTVFLIISIAGPVLKDIYLDILLGKKDTRTLAREYIEGHISSGSRIGLVGTFYVPQLKPTREQILNKYEAAMRDRLSGAKIEKIELTLKLTDFDLPYYELYYLYPSTEQSDALFRGQPALSIDVAKVRKKRIAYIVISKEYPGQKIREDFFWRWLDDNGSVIAEFNPFKTEDTGLEKANFISPTACPYENNNIFTRTRLGPVIRIYKLRV